MNMHNQLVLQMNTIDDQLPVEKWKPSGYLLLTEPIFWVEIFMKITECDFDLKFYRIWWIVENM